MALPSYQAGQAADYVTSKNWKFKTSGDQLNLEVCPLCQADKFKFYINNATGLWDCKSGSCGRKGNFYLLQREFGDAPDIRALGNDPPQAKKPMRWALSDNAAYEATLATDPEALAFLATRGLTLATAQAWHLGVKTERAGKALVIPYLTTAGDIADIKYRAMYPDANPKYWRRGGGESILYGEHMLPGADVPHPTLTIVEGEIDSLTLWQHGFGPVLSTTTGAQSFNERWYDIIKAYAPEKLIICYDSDPAGQKAAAHLLKKFDDLKCVVNLVLPVKDANEFFLTKTAADFQQLLDDAAPPELEGFRTLTSVFDELETQMFLGEESFIGAASQFSELNSMINGGYWNGFVITVTGTAGTGKTTFVLQELLYAAEYQKVPTWLCCLEMPEVMVLRKAIEHRYGIPMMTQTLRDIQDARVKMESTVPFYIGSRVHSMDQLVKTATLAVKRYDLKMLAFDNLNYFVRAATNEAQELSLVTKRLKELAMELNIPILLVAQPAKIGSNTDDKIMTMNDLKGSSSISQDSDIVIILHRKRRASTVKEYRGGGAGFEGNQSPFTMVRVDKARYSAGGEMFLYFQGDISTYRPVTELERIRLREENGQ